MELTVLLVSVQQYGRLMGGRTQYSSNGSIRTARRFVCSGQSFYAEEVFEASLQPSSRVSLVDSIYGEVWPSPWPLAQSL